MTLKGACVAVIQHYKKRKRSMDMENEQNEQVDTQKEEETKTFTEEEFQKAIQDRLERERKSQANKLEEAEKDYQAQIEDLKSKLGENDREAFDLRNAQNQITQKDETIETLQAEIATLKADKERSELKDKAINLLNEKNLPTDERTLNLVLLDSAEKTVDAIESLYEYTSGLVKEQAQSDAPIASGGLGSTVNNQTKADIFSNANIFNKER